MKKNIQKMLSTCCYLQSSFVNGLQVLLLEMLCQLGLLGSLEHPLLYLGGRRILANLPDHFTSQMMLRATAATEKKT